MKTKSQSLLSDLLSEAEAAKRLGVCERTLINWRVLKKCPPVTRIGRRVFYRRDSVEAWIKNQEVAA